MDSIGFTRPGYLAALKSFVPAENPCMSGGASYTGSGQILLLPADEIVRRLGLDPSRADAVRAGAVVTRELPASSTRGSTVAIARGTSLVDPTATGPVDPDVRVEQQVDLPVVELPRTPDTEGRMLNASLLLAADSAVTEDWPTRTASLTVRDPVGGSHHRGDSRSCSSRWATSCRSASSEASRATTPSSSPSCSGCSRCSSSSSR